MKHFIILLSLLLIPLISCSDNSESLLGPDVENSFEKSTALNTPDIPITDYELIPLPPKAIEWQDSVFSVSQTINGLLGGIITLDKFYLTDNGQVVTISANLVIPHGAFEGNKTITVTLDNEYAALHFYPSMTFDKPLRLTQHFTGLDLTNYDTGTIDFVYIDDDGTVELIRDNGVQVILPQGLVRVLNASLYHFSRYGWSRGPQRMFTPYSVPID